MLVLLLWSGLITGVVVEWVDYGCCCGVRSMQVLLLWSGLITGVVVEWLECGCWCVMSGSNCQKQARWKGLCPVIIK